MGSQEGRGCVRFVYTKLGLRLEWKCCRSAVAVRNILAQTTRPQQFRLVVLNSRDDRFEYELNG